MQTKMCTVCGENKTLDQYRKYSGRGKLGLRPLCKECQRAYERTWRSNSKEARKETRARRRDKAKIYSQEYRVRNRAKYLIAQCRRRSVKQGIEFNLDSYIQEIQTRMDKGFCELTGVPLNLNSIAEKPSFDVPSIDRIDSMKGYVYSNIRIVCFAANAMLGSWGEVLALEMAKSWIAKMEN